MKLSKFYQGFTKVVIYNYLGKFYIYENEKYRHYMGRKGVYTNEKRMWRLLLAGIVILSEVMAAGADVAYAKPAEMETDDNYAELTDMEEDFYAGFLEMYNAADTEQRGDETQEQELISPSEGEKKQYIVTLADDGKWVSIKTDPKHDDIGQGGARAQAAQIVCNRTIRRFHECKRDCVAPFVIEGLNGYGGNGEGAFRMLDFQKCANEITNNYRNKLGKYSYQK